MARVVLAPVHTALLQTWTVLASSAVAASHTGNTTETALATVNLPAGLMGANGILRIIGLWSFTNSGNNKTIRTKLGATAFTQITATTTQTNQSMTIIRNRNSAAVQVGNPISINGLGTQAVAVTTGTIDTAASQNITMTAELANAGETITLEAYTIELLTKA